VGPEQESSSVSCVRRWIAVSRPSFLAPSLTVCLVAGLCPVFLHSFSRSWANLTGLPVLCDRRMARNVDLSRTEEL
jgi:hypothetical protein